MRHSVICLKFTVFNLSQLYLDSNSEIEELMDVLSNEFCSHIGWGDLG